MKEIIHFQNSLSFLASAALLSAWLALTPAARAGDAPGDFTKGVIDLGMVVKDPGQTAAFLTNAIGFKEVKGFSVTPELGRKIGLIDGYPADVRMFVLTDGDLATRIKVLSFPQADMKKSHQKYIHSVPGFRYLTLYVKDMNKAIERLKAANVRTIGETPLDLGGGTYIAVIKDPDGNFFELIGPMKK
jgi:catechol 2,3-dioxygenase-like lactoylglutathione lyase family enzyme